MKVSVLRDKSKSFALRIIRLYNFLKDSKPEYVMSKQLIRCGTSIGANVTEAFYEQSEADFISKLFIAQKEAAETAYRLELLHESNLLDDSQYQSIHTDAIELLKLLISFIKTMNSEQPNH